MHWVIQCLILAWRSYFAGHFAIGWDWPQSLLLGAILSSTDAASVFAIFKSRRLNLKGETAQLIEVESGSNDPMAHMLTLAMISVLNGKGEGIGLVWNVILEIALGVGLGILIAKVAALVLKNLKFKTEGLNSLFIFAVAILSFAMPDSLGGNGYLSVYIVGLLIGNEDFLGKKSLVHFFDGLTGLMEMIKRGDERIIPNGQTILQSGDQLVILDLDD